MMVVTKEKLEELVRQQGYPDLPEFERKAGLHLEWCAGDTVRLGQMTGTILAVHLRMSPDELYDELKMDDNNIIHLTETG